VCQGQRARTSKKDLPEKIGGIWHAPRGLSRAKAAEPNSFIRGGSRILLVREKKREKKRSKGLSEFSGDEVNHKREDAEK